MNKTYVADILKFFEENKIKYQYHSWMTIPSEHVFATYFVPSERFDGHDLYAEYCDYTLEIYFYFKGHKSNSDFVTENMFEESVRAAGRFTKNCGYDSAHDYFYTNYTFEFKEWFPNGT